MQINRDSKIRRSYEAARRTNLDNYKLGAVLANERMIVGLNRVQIRLGQTAAGSAIKPKYSRGYNKLKLQMNTFKAPSMTPDLYVTGDFQKGMGMKVPGKTYTFFSADVKAEKLLARYKGIFGLQESNKLKARVKVTNLWLKRIHDAISSK